MPRASASSAPKRRSPRRKAAYEDTPRLLSEAEKHQLIRIHAARRAPQDPLQRMSLWAGVSLCVGVLLVGWWMSVGSGIKESMSGPSEELRTLTEELNRFQQEVETNPLLNPPTVAPATTSEATAAEMFELLRTNATRTRDLMVPPDENPPPTEPTTPPGLTPDES